MDVILDQSSDHLSCCRVCLLTDCKLFNIHEYKLADAFSRISGTPVFKGRLPQYLCTFCHTQLLKCAQFRQMCLQTERCLKQELLEGELNTDRIRIIDRTALKLVHLTVTDVESLDYPPTTVVGQPNVCIHEPKIERIAKHEDTDSEADTVDTNEMCTDYDDFDANVDYDDILANPNIVNKYQVKEPGVAVAVNKNNIGIVKQNIVKFTSNINTVTANVRNGDKVQAKEPDLAVAPNKDNIGIVKQNIVKVTSSIKTLSANVRNGDKVQAKKHIVDVAPNKHKVGIVKQNIVKVTANIPNVAANISHREKANMPETGLKTVNADSPVSKPNLKMELEILKGELKIKVVKDVKSNPTMKEMVTEISNNGRANVGNVKKWSPEEILLRNVNRANAQVNVSNVKKRSPEEILLNKINKATKEKKMGTDNKKERKAQIHIFKNFQDMLNILRISNTDVLTDTGRQNKVFDTVQFERDYGVKIITLSKQEQLEEIASRKQSANYLQSRYKCEDCGRAFGLESTYNNHRRRHSPMAGDAVCEICSLRFERHNRRRGHQLAHQLKFVCDTCGYVARSRTNARVHHAMHEGKIFTCPHCDKIFRKPSTYLSHVRIAHPAAHVACELCGETFIGPRGLHAHHRLMHKHSQNQKPQPQHKCTVCPASFMSLDALNTHTDLGEHAGSPCEQCGESCASEDALRAHVEARHPPEEHRCEECCMTFSSRTAYDVHYRRKHLNERAPQYSVGRAAARRRAPRPAQPVMCDQCGKILKMQSAAQLRAHMNKHLGLRPYACPLCPKTFTDNYLRKTHLRLHSGERPFQCSLCPLAFAVKGNMKRHYKVVHLGEHDNATCPVCARVCTTRGSLRLHIRAVHEHQGWPKRKRAARPHRDGDGESSAPPRRRRTEKQASPESDSDEELSSPPTPTLEETWTGEAADSDDGSESPPEPPRRQKIRL